MYIQYVCICLCIYQTCIYVGKNTTVISIEYYHASIYVYMCVILCSACLRISPL